MAAQDSLTPRQFHGSNHVFQPGDQVQPRNELGDIPGRAKGLGPSQHGSLVWSTDDPGYAASRGQNVYEIAHNGLSNRLPGVQGSTVSLGATVIKKVNARGR